MNERRKPLPLSCACCGSDAGKWKQFSNQDAGIPWRERLPESNPLIGESTDETVEKVAEALAELMGLLSESKKHTGLFYLIAPMYEALKHEVKNHEKH